MKLLTIEAVQVFGILNKFMDRTPGIPMIITVCIFRN